MRTTITLASDVEVLVKEAMQRRHKTFKEVVNDALREGLGARSSAVPFRTATFRTGKPLVDLDKALQLAGALEDDELQRKLRIGK